MNIGYGKIILLGEHFVVHNLPAIVTALNLATEVTLEKLNATSALQIIDNRQKVPTFKPLKIAEYEQMVHALFKHMGIEPSGLRVTFSGTLPVTNGGIGASAAAAVALARAINNTYARDYTNAQINQAAYAGEREVHGNPSGIDNTAATFGGLFTYKKAEGIVTRRPQKTNGASDTTLHLVIADSGCSTNTKQVIAAVKAFAAQNAEHTQIIFDRYLNVFARAQEALENNNLHALGQAMNQNHELLQELTVSSPELDYLVSLALDAGALGAKLTGTGCGGLMVALAHKKQAQDAIALRLQKAGFFTLTQSIQV